MAPNIRPVNRRALRQYGEFWQALQAVGEALTAAERLAARATDGKANGHNHWLAATPEEMKAAAKKAGQSLHVISSAAKKWEAELISREWRR
jgi:hypothetical protein